MPKRPSRGAPPLKAGIAEMRALAHPLRLRMIELFAEMPRTTRQVAELLGQPPTRLYHHVAALERAGLLKVTETRKKRGTVETWYEAISRTIGSHPVPTPSRGEGRAAKRAVVTAVLEQSRREVLNAMSGRGGEPPMVARLIMSSPAFAIPTVRKRLYKFVKDLKREYECEGPTTGGDGERWAVTLTYAPVWPAPGNPRGA